MMFRARPLMPFAALLLLLPLPTLRAADEIEKDTPEKIVADFTTQMNAVAKIYAGVTDEASAKTAVPDLEKAIDAIIAVVDRMNKIPDPPADAVKQLAAAMQKGDEQMDAIVKTMSAKNPKGLALLEAVADKLEKHIPPAGWMKTPSTEQAK